jgi:hypothetical protein
LRIWHLLIASALLILLFRLSYPYYRYFVDPDAVAYLTMAKRAAEGDTWRLVNALWSPFHPAIVAGLIRIGMDALLAAQLSNLGAALLLLTAGFGIFRRVGLRSATGFPLLLALAGFLCYAIYKQLFCDLFQVALLLGYLNLLLHPRFIQRPLLWIGAALLMALATYAKVYSFYFLLLQFPLSLYLIAKQQGARFPLRAWVSGLALQLLLLAPLAGLMHEKYGFWGLSKSGALNTSWTLVGHKSPKAGVEVLIPPPYLNSPYTWEDPYLSEGVQHGRFESPKMMLKQVAVSARACMQAFEAMNELSALLLAVYLLTALYWWRRKNELPISLRLLTLSAAIMPLGYLLLHVEARYFWLLLPIGMALGGYWIGQEERFFRSSGQRRLATILYALTFIVWPAYDMKELFRKGEDIYKLAQVLSWMNVRGSFTSNDNPSRAGCLAYWMGINYYTPAAEVVKREELIRDMRRWNVNFYLHHQNGLDATTVTMTDEKGQPLDRMDGGKIRGLQVFLVNP